MDVGRIGAAYGTPAVPPNRGDRPVPPAANTQNANADAVARAAAARQVAEQRAAAAAESAAKAAAQVRTPQPTEVRTERHAATGTYVYEFVDPSSREVMYEIPSRRVLDLVASLMAKLGRAEEESGSAPPPVR